MCKGLTCTTKNTDFSSGKVDQTGTDSHFSPRVFWKFDEEPTDIFSSSVTNLINLVSLELKENVLQFTGRAEASYQ